MILSNYLKGRAVVSTNSTVTISTTDLQLPNETVKSLRVTRLFFSGSISIGNSSATLLSANGTDHWSLDTAGAALGPMANVVITVTSGDCLVVIDKNSSMLSNANTGYM